MNDKFFEQYSYLCGTFYISRKTHIIEKDVDAQSLISPYRLDFMAKLLMLDAKYGAFDKRRAYTIYRRHLKAFTNRCLVEAGQPDKKGMSCYLKTFRELLQNMDKQNGEVLRFGFPIPVDAKYMALDGAHRISIAIYYKRKIPIYFLADKVIPNNYDYCFFRKRYLEEEYILEMVKKYIRIRACSLWIFPPKTLGCRKIREIKKNCTPVYMKKMEAGACLMIFDRQWTADREKEAEFYLEGIKAEVFYDRDEILSKLEQNDSGLVRIHAFRRIQIFIGKRWKHYWESLKYIIKKAMKRPV